MNLGSEMWAEGIEELGLKEMANERRVGFARVQEVRFLIRRLRRFNFPERANYLEDQLRTAMAQGGLRGKGSSRKTEPEKKVASWILKTIFSKANIEKMVKQVKEDGVWCVRKAKHNPKDCPHPIRKPWYICWLCSSTKKTWDNNGLFGLKEMKVIQS